MVSETTIASAALAVALVALLTTVSQVLGQFFATADGYRRCQPSVMGRWAKLTRRKFRWSELRFETIYVTPRFELYPYRTIKCEDIAKGVGRAMEGGLYYPLDGSPEMTRKTNSHHAVTERSLQLDSPSELASWVRFIDALHANSSETLECVGLVKDERLSKVLYLRAVGEYSMPSVTPQKRSWDFVPPEVIKPLALITVGDIAIMARRLGMEWKDFDPSQGSLRAEGNGHTISSAIVRSLGTVLQIETRAPKWAINKLYIPFPNADKMGFGIVPGDLELKIPDHRLGTEQEVLETLRTINIQAADTVKDIMSANPGWTPGISDIIGLAAPIMRLFGSSIIRVPQPSGYAVGLTQQEEGFVVFHNRLRDLISQREKDGIHVSNQTRAILQQYKELLDMYGKQWEDQHQTLLNETPISFLDDLVVKHYATTTYFKTLQNQYPSEKGGSDGRFCYLDLVYSHITHAVNYFPDALARSKENRERDHYGMRVAGWITEGAHIYFDNIPKVQDEMTKRGFHNADVVEEAWFTMMFRAFLWHRIHHMVEGARVPSIHWGSQLPVYIG